MGGSTSFPVVNFSPERIVIVTGGNTGIGYEVAKQIAMMGAHVIIACRSEERALAAIERMKSEDQLEKKERSTNSTPKTLSLEYMKLDLKSLRSVKEFVEKFKSSGRKLHTLVCNAGISFHPQDYTEDDNEMHFQVNYLSHFLLTLKLLPIMIQSGEDCRVVNVSSFMHYNAIWNLEEIQGRQFTSQKFNRGQYYIRSKAYQVMQMYVMDQKLSDSNVIISCIDPGFVRTEISRNFQDKMCISCLFTCFSKCAKSPLQGADCAIDAAVNPNYRGIGGVYYSNCRRKETAEVTRNKKAQKQLWDYTLERLKGHISDTDLQVFETKAA